MGAALIITHAYTRVPCPGPYRALAMATYCSYGSLSFFSGATTPTSPRSTGDRCRPGRLQATAGGLTHTHARMCGVDAGRLGWRKKLRSSRSGPWLGCPAQKSAKSATFALYAPWFGRLEAAATPRLPPRRDVVARSARSPLGLAVDASFAPQRAHGAPIAFGGKPGAWAGWRQKKTAGRESAPAVRLRINPESQTALACLSVPYPRIAATPQGRRLGGCRRLICHPRERVPNMPCLRSLNRHPVPRAADELQAV